MLISACQHLKLWPQWFFSSQALRGDLAHACLCQLLLQCKSVLTCRGPIFLWEHAEAWGIRDKVQILHAQASSNVDMLLLLFLGILFWCAWRIVAEARTDRRIFMQKELMTRSLMVIRRPKQALTHMFVLQPGQLAIG